MDEAKRVVLITYQFPPMGSAGSQRMLAFARHLEEFGWQPIVVTVGRLGISGQDRSLLARLDERARIHRWFTPLSGAWAMRRRSHATPPVTSGKNGGAVREASPGAAIPRQGSGPGPWGRIRSRGRRIVENTLAVPDHAVAWSVASGIRAGNWMRTHGVRAVVSTSPPYSTLLAGSLARSLSGGVWIADLRDPWATFTVDRTSTFKHWAGRSLHRHALRCADRVLANTERFRQALIEDPDVTAERIAVLPNGYDFEEIQTARSTARERGSREPLTVVHAGTLYKEMRQPVEVLRAMAKVRDETPDDRAIQLVLPGDSAYHEATELRDLIASLGLTGAVEFPGYLPHAKVLALEASADVLLLIQGAGFRMQVPSKAYEYLAIGRPVLAITPDGATADLIRSSPVGHVVAPGDEEAIAAFFRQQLRETQSERRLADPPPGVLSRRELSRRLAEILDEATARPHNGSR